MSIQVEHKQYSGMGRSRTFVSAERGGGPVAKDVEPAVAAAIRKSFLAGVPSPVVERLAGRPRLHEIRAGQLFICSDEPYRCGIVVDGLARAYRRLPTGAELTMRRVGAGAAVGIRAMVGRRNDLNVVAITDCLFLPLDADELVRLARECAALAWAIAQELTRRLDDTQLQTESAMAGSVLQKVCGALLDVGIEGEPLEVAMSQERLAEMVGASREAVGRELRGLAAARLIQLMRGRIRVVDPLGLESVARDRSRRQAMAYRRHSIGTPLQAG